MILVLICLVTLIVGAFGLAWHRTLYWRRRSVPGPTPDLFFGSLIQLGHIVYEPMPFKLVEWTKQYGRFFGIQRGWVNALVVSDYDMAKQIFIDQFENFYERDLMPLVGDVDNKPSINVFSARGLRWKRLRVLTSMVFTTKNLKRVFPTVVSCADRLCESLEEDLKDGSVINILMSMKELTTDVILRTTFDRHEERPVIQALMHGVIDSFGQQRGWLFRLAWMFPAIGPFLEKINTWSMLRVNPALADFYRRVPLTVNQRKKEKQLSGSIDADSNQPADVVDLLLEAESEEVVLHKNDTFSKKNSQVEKHLSVLEVIETCQGFLRAGFDTTANTLASSIYYLVKHPEKQEKLRAEVELHCPGEDFDYDSLLKVKYADAVFQETLRLRPVSAAFTSRRCTKSTKVGPVEIEKGTDILLDVLTLHHDKKVFGEDAAEFRPERWLEENPPHSSFLGFGDGLRICAGLRLVYLEQRVALAKLVRHYRFYEVPETKDAEVITGVIMGPKSVIVRVEKID